MLNNKKGVSEVVANVLIVLLVIVGIAVIWSVVKPTIDKGAGGIQNAGDCFSVSVSPVSCTRGVAAVAAVNGVCTTATSCTGTGQGTCASGQPCFAATNGVCTTATSCTGTGQGTCASGQTCVGYTPAVVANGITPGSDRVVVQRNSGGGAFENVVFIFSEGAVSSPYTPTGADIIASSTLAELASATRTIAVPVPPISSASAAHKVNIVAKVGGQLCQVTETPIDCN